MDPCGNLVILANRTEVYDLLKSSPAGADFQLFLCGKGEDIPSFIEANSIRIAVLDVEDPPAADLELLKRLKKSDPRLTTIVIGPTAPPDEIMDWIEQGASDVLTRPLEVGALGEILKKILEKCVLRRETFILEKRLEKKYVFHGLVSKNPVLFEIFGKVESIAKHFASVLITGETGTGKDLVARAIHGLSEVRNARLVACDCASIPENLFESELFGCVRGAFTGADRTKRGLFEEAQDGTIFLDEIGEIPLPVQAKLLRALENRQFRPLGSNEIKYANVRVIAATNRDLGRAIKSGVFREDLLRRLNRVAIHLPPLRERMEDVPLLIRHFLEILNRAHGKDLKGVSRDVQKLFLKLSWPGNVRELENALHSAAMVAKKNFIDVGDLPKELRKAASAPVRTPPTVGGELASLDEVEKDYIVYILKTAGYNLKKSAAILGVSRTTLYNKMAKYGLTRE
jgi:two-component system response regulator HydG